MTLRARLLMGFMTLSLPLLLLILFLIPKINMIVYLNQKIQIINISQVLDSQVYDTQDVLKQWVMNKDPKEKSHFADVWVQLERDKEQAGEKINKWDNLKLKEEWNQLQGLYNSFHEAQLSIINASSDSNNSNNVEHIKNKTNVLKNAIINIIDGTYSEQAHKRMGGLYHEISKGIEKNTSKINSELVSLKLMAYVLLILAIFLTAIIPYITQQAITRPIDNAINIAERIAAGERAIEIHIPSEDKLGKLLSSLKIMQEAIEKNEEILRTKEMESRELIDNAVNIAERIAAGERAIEIHVSSEDKLGKFLSSLKIMQEAIEKNEEILRTKEMESRELFEKLVTSSKKFRLHSSKVAAGDLRERLEIDKEDLLQDLGKDLNSMTDGLAEITKKITQVSNSIVTQVDTVLNSANEQAEGITSQATAINEISASLEEIDKSSKKTMAKAQALREVAKNTYEQGKLGTESIEQSIEGIKASEGKMKIIAQTILDLSHHMQQIGDITLVVNTLAQQSKMLALNASIEASKAGEAGKGFAAVATEVRNLAEQSEQSTTQVQKILEDIRRTTEKAVTVTEEGTKSLDSGTKLIEQAGQVIQALSKMINEASISSQHIEVAIHQETVGIEQIVEAMNKINRSTSTFSSGVNEMMIFIHNLNDIAKHLKEDVDFYKV